MRFGLLALLLVAACAAPAADEPTEDSSGEALSNDVLRSALVANEIGETPAGYLGIVAPETASDELKRNVADNTIKRRAVYTQIAEKMILTTVQAVAKQTACNVYQTNILVGYVYQNDDGSWSKRTETAPVVMPKFCTTGSSNVIGK